jgi:hypothetical protein
VKQSRTPRRIELVGLGAVIAVSAAIGVYASLSRPGVVEPPSRAEAEAVLDHAVRLAQAGDLTGLCQSVAAASGICRNLAEGARESGWAPGPERPDVVSVSHRGTGTTVLRLRGTRADGSLFESDFGVSRDQRGLRSTTPVYWSGVTIP